MVIAEEEGVEKAVEWFNKDFKGVLGQAHKVMTMDDPFEEVTYDDEFACNDLGNKYLDDITIDRVFPNQMVIWFRRIQNLIIISIIVFAE